MKMNPSIRYPDFSAVLTALWERGKISRLDCIARKNLLQCGMGAAATAGLRDFYTPDHKNECYLLTC